MWAKRLFALLLIAVLGGCAPPATPNPLPDATATNPDTSDIDVPVQEAEDEEPPSEAPSGGDEAFPLPSTDAKPMEQPRSIPAPVIPDSEPLRKIAATANQVVLTFDDGPSRYTEEILAILNEEGVPAVFFFLGHIDSVPELAQKVVNLGHQVGTHTLSHLRLPDLDPEQWKAEILEGRDRLEAVTGSAVGYFRPPFGRRTEEILEFAAQNGLVTVLWDIDSRDWELADNPEQIIQNVLSQVRPGSIILLHERPQTVEVLPELIAALREAGFTFEPLPPVILPGEEGEGIQIPPPERLFYANTERVQEILSLVNPPEQAEDTPDDTK